MIDTDAIRIQIDELRATIIELRQDLADAEIEVDRLTADNKGLITCLKKDVTYKQAVELAKREHEITKLTEQNKLMREALGEIIAKATIEVAMTPAAFPDFYQGYKEGLVKAGEIAQDALTAIKGEPI